MSFFFSMIQKILPQSILRKFHKRKMEDIFQQGYNDFELSGKTSDEAYQRLISLYCYSNGYSTEAFHQKIRHKNPPKIISSNLQGVLGEVSIGSFNAINKNLDKNGYVEFDKKLNRDILERLYDFALQTGAKIPPEYDSKIIYDVASPRAEIYRFDIQDLIDNVDIQSLIMDPTLINIARNYLKCEPIFDFPAMWWSTSFSKKASSEAAQLYHFDMDRIKWLKVFFYINDVNEENGPHCYIEGTHKAGTKPMEILQRGYARISDEDLRPYYKPEDFKVLCAKAGTIFAGDTKCWHKGTALKTGHRLVLEFEYTSSLFGANIPKMQVKNTSPAFFDFCLNNKVYASNIEFINNKL